MEFYCDDCGARVSRNSTSCPSCGVEFQAIKCPSCDYTDSPKAFAAGCPKCGYTVEGTYPTRRRRWWPNLENSKLWVLALLLIGAIGLFIYLILKP